MNPQKIENLIETAEEDRKKAQEDVKKDLQVQENALQKRLAARKKRLEEKRSMNGSLNMVAEVHERLENEYYISGGMEGRKVPGNNEARPLTVKAGKGNKIEEMDMSMINKDSTNVETNYHDISGVDLLHRLQEAERQEPRLSDPVDSDEEYEHNIQEVIQRADQVSKTLQEEKDAKMEQIVEDFTTQWIEAKMKIKADYDFIFKKLDPVKHKEKFEKFQAKL